MKLNPDEEYVKEIRQKLKESGGYQRNLAESSRL